MDVIVARSRIPGTASTYHYRALVPLAEVAATRRARCVVIQARIGNGRVPSTRIADVVAPAAWYDRDLATPFGLAARLNLVARRIEAIIIRTVFPEMTARLTPLTLALEFDPGEAGYRVAVSDLNAAFDRIAPDIDTLMAADLGLYQGCDLRAA
ncbi:hypothetical protein HL653_12410 [Sphingomonas sp. AP4-R1]|uniref:hypothetical protein n=1 Tax=Sphingomonas sp. AP4-R1 TaxID=2735134 RepID=UPI001493608E|nr:hypothetical protein [Sphingomonas sp. AP4-R1]QJU58461.1 hypothetical protein HL653_12410 [Sphingomonas sp. AP4-R1]